MNSMGIITTAASAPGSMPATSIKMPKIMTNNPTRTTRRGFAVGRSFGIPMAANTSAADNGRMRTPVSQGTELQNYGQEQRDRKEHARLDQKLREEHGKSATELAVSQHRRIKQRLLPRSGQASLPAQESVHDQEPGDQQPHHRGKPDQLRSVGFGLHPTPTRSSAVRRRTIMPSPTTDKIDPT